MIVDNDNNSDRQRDSNPRSDSELGEKSQMKKKKPASGSDVGKALQTVYQRTIEEDIPPDLLDLLGKLG